MKLNIALLAGDGIGPEIMAQGVDVLNAVAEKFGHDFSYNEAICGAHAIDEVGDPSAAFFHISDSGVNGNTDNLSLPRAPESVCHMNACKINCFRQLHNISPLNTAK